MRKEIALSLLALALLINPGYSPEQILRATFGESLWSKLTLPLHLFRLITKSADEVLLMPVQGIHVRHVANTWRAPRPGGRMHQGQDIFAQRGTPVLSATEGIVMHIGEGGLGGKTVLILGAGGRSYYYAHLQRHAEDLDIGDAVTTDTVIGYVGNTGNARPTPPHLHFGVYGVAGATNPLPLLRDRSAPR